MSRRAHSPTEELRIKVQAFAVVGVPHHDIALLVDMSIKTLLKYYGRELALGKASGNAEMSKRLFAIGSNDKRRDQLSAIIFWLKAQAGWRETQAVEFSGPGGGPMTLQVKVKNARDRNVQLLEAIAGRIAGAIAVQGARTIHQADEAGRGDALPVGLAQLVGPAGSTGSAG